MIGIYQIRNKQNGDLYVGSAIDIKSRWRRHKKDLRSSIRIHHSIILQRAWEKYGEDSFIFELVEKCSVKQLEEKENFYLNKLSPKYNICPKAYSQVGRKLTEEHKEKLSKYALENNIEPPKEYAQKKRKAVIKLDYDTLEELESFESLTKACESVGRDYTFSSTISQVCKGKRKSAFGYKWKFNNENKTDERVQ